MSRFHGRYVAVATLFVLLTTTRFSRAQDDTPLHRAKVKIDYVSRESPGKGVTVARMNNGLTVIVRENHAAPVATVGTILWVLIAYKFHQRMIDAVTGAQLDIFDQGHNLGAPFDVLAVPAATIEFIRGDANDDGLYNIADPVYILDTLFSGGNDPVCDEAVDANDDGSIDMYYWYYATLAMFQVGGPSWRKWNAHMKEAIVNHQHPKNAGSKKGSWDPIGPWGPDGGRVYSTAVLAMCLEVYYRYDKVIGVR